MKNATTTVVGCWNPIFVVFAPAVGSFSCVLSVRNINFFSHFHLSFTMHRNHLPNVTKVTYKRNKIIVTCTSGEVSATASRSSTATCTTSFPVGPYLLACHCCSYSWTLKKLSGIWEVHPCVMWSSVGRGWGFVPCWFCRLFGLWSKEPRWGCNHPCLGRCWCQQGNWSITCQHTNCSCQWNMEQPKVFLPKMQ